MKFRLISLTCLFFLLASTYQKCCRRGVRSQPFVGELFIASGDDPTTQEDRPHLRTHGRAPSRVA